MSAPSNGSQRPWLRAAVERLELASAQARRAPGQRSVGRPLRSDLTASPAEA